MARPESHNVDDVLISQQIDQPLEPLPKPVEAEKPEPEPEPLPEVQPHEAETEASTDKVQEETKAVEAPEEKAEPLVDDYGSEVSKPRMYSEDEVQRMIRERLSRGNHQQQPTPQQVQQAAQDFVADPNSSEDWQTQLKTFVKQTFQEINTEQQREQWQRAEQQKQVEFESNFNAGMSKYDDFHEVVAGKPITDSMMLATRALKNPAAFIYAASKNFPKELERIAQLNDPYSQVLEVGRLEERMKAKPKVSNTPIPSTQVRGDISSKTGEKRSIDDLIRIDAKKKFSGR